MQNITKPKLVFFQFKHGKNLPNFILLHRQQHVKCLSEFFEVILIHEDCDYQQICDKYQPELTLFENAGNILDVHRPKINNTHTHPQIPKLGFLNADAWCNSRPVFLSDMEHWGVETFFSISVTAAEHTPEIAGNLFVWPNFVDTEIYRDYNESKIVPVFFTGANYALYPWRQKIIQHISQYYPSLICPHLGYSGNRSTRRMIYGEQYARTINASWFVPTCGTVAKEVVRKHFEIPASRACLITEQSPVLEAAGFVDMHNCVFADENNVLDKLDYLFQNQDELENIINAGYQLVHSRHTLKQRDQIFQWFNLNKNIKSHQTVIQTSPFEPLIVVEKSSGLINCHIKCNGLNLMLIQQGDKELASHQYDRAEALYLRCFYHVGIMHEPKLRLAICSLYKGNAEKSLEWIVPLIKCILEIYKAFDPDPVEWAYFVISLLCQGKLDEAIKRAEQFPSLSHPELNRTRWVISILKNKEYTLPPINQSKYRASIHQLPNRNLDDWINNLYIMLKASQQLDLAETLRKFIALADQELKPQKSNFRAGTELLSKYSAAIQNSLFKKSSSFFGIQHSIDPIHILFRQRLKRQCGNFLRRLESRFGYFLPYHLSLKRNDEFFHAIQYLTQSEDIKTALLLGASSQAGSTQAFLTGIQQNPNKPTVFCINIHLPQFIKLQKHYANHSVVKCYEVSSGSLENLSQEIENVIKKIKQENQIDFFDVVLLDGSELNVRTDLANELHRGRIVMLDDVNINQKIYYDLLTDNTYMLDAENSGLRNGYAIFKKSNYLVLT
jgi:hypothetical protein